MISAFAGGCPAINCTKRNVTESSANIKEYKDGLRKTLGSPFGEIRGTKYYRDNSTYIYVTDDKSIEMLVDRDNDGIVDQMRAKQYLDTLEDRNEKPLLFKRADQILKYWNEN